MCTDLKESFHLKLYMKIHSFKTHQFEEIAKKDDTGRSIGYSLFENAMLVGRNLVYPNALIYKLHRSSDDDKPCLFSPYDEKIMSLNKDSFYDDNVFEPYTNIAENVCVIPVYFLVYNFDNYYHFLYDTLPYLYQYLYLKKIIPELKLLLNYPNTSMNYFYAFNMELLAKLINTKDIIIVNPTTMYSKIYVGTSHTHGSYSNRPPRPEIFEIYERIKQNIVIENIDPKYLNLSKIYISRRTWIHNDYSNIGTNYTTRRKMVNEDELVEKLQQNGVTEIFAEKLNIDEKIYLFSNASLICGSIGGGMANLLFSTAKTKAIVIVTPFFLEINRRFHFSMEHTQLIYFYSVCVDSESKIPLFCRVQISNNGQIGEICKYNREKDTYLVCLSNNDVAGFNHTMKFNTMWFSESDFTLLDHGLNSPYIIQDIDKFISMIE